jgi:hypothetical protein
MRAWVALTVAELGRREPADLAARLAAEQAHRGYSGTVEQQVAWEAQCVMLQRALRSPPDEGWWIALEFDLLRLEKRVDAVLLTRRAIYAIECKTAPPSPAALTEAEDYALDLRDFHAGSRHHPVVPVLVAGTGGFVPPAAPPLLWEGVPPPLACGSAGLAELIAWAEARIPARTELDGAAWLAAPYRPVPGIVEAATMLYARNGVADIAAARADAASLQRTSRAIARAIAAARAEDRRIIVFVTGIPGAGKTLCGLNAVFGAAREEGAAFLSGNAPLIAVLREALARDAVRRGEAGAAEAGRRVKAALQNVHRFLEDGALDPRRSAAERVIVFDEAQRAWDEVKARRGTQNRPGRLSMSEPAQTLDIMARRPGWSVVIALIGQGQEINTGEAGLAEWGRVLAARGGWRARAARRVLEAEEPAQLLAAAPADWLEMDDDLHLDVPIRSVREPAGAAWVDALLRDDAAEARRIAAEVELPFFLTRDLEACRAALRRLARGSRRAGLLRSSGAKRLRGDGLAAEVPPDEVANWFLNRWPDVRASDALEQAATEYACQGLELDVAGLAWGGDFRRGPRVWQAHRFVGTRWQRDAKEEHFVRNTYRVLLTRARYETVIWVPRGSAEDTTREAAMLDAVAGFLHGCGSAGASRHAGAVAVGSLDAFPPPRPPAPRRARPGARAHHRLLEHRLAHPAPDR